MSTPQNAFKPFSWLSPDAEYLPGAQHAADTYDAAKGIALLLEMVEESDLAIEGGGVPNFNPVQRSALLRMAMASARMLENEAWKHIGWLNTHGVARAKAAA
ncbi:MAG: hypothetical protein JSR69_09260 [Proteobacteria bacterium]|nr:hypothetical protein [Pseudomonadota bacterium]